MFYKKLLPEFYAHEDTLRIVGRAPARGFGDRISVLVWNIYKRRRKNWAQQFDAMLNRVDLVLIQEAVLAYGGDPLFESGRPYEWVMARSFKNPKSNMDTGVNTGAIVASTHNRFFHSSDLEPLLKTPKMLLATLYPLEGRISSLLVLNMHALNFVSGTKFTRHVDQIAHAVQGHAGPIILGGDFNTWNAARYNTLLTITQKAGLAEVRFPRRKALRHLNRHLDHVFYAGLKLESAITPSGLIASDHDPILVNFSILADII